MALVLICQLGLVAFHQITTLVDFFPFNGSRNYTPKEKVLECSVNGVPMLLPPIGFGFHIRALATFGVIYYFILFTIELLIWWIPYLTVPSGRWRGVYNRLLSFSTFQFEGGDLYARWYDTYNRLHRAVPSQYCQAAAAG